MLSDAALRQLSQGQGGTYHFDFSVIPADRYESLFRSLQKFAIKNIDSLQFSCKELSKYTSKSKARTMSPNVLSSIAKNKTHYVRNMVELLYHILPRSQRINEIVLSCLAFKPEFFERLGIAFSKSVSLKTIILDSINLGDDGLRSLLAPLNPDLVNSITVTNCGISDVSLRLICEFIHKKSSPHTGLQEFIVSDPEMAEQISRAFSGHDDADEVEDFGSSEDFSSIPPSPPPVETVIQNSRAATLRKENQEIREQIKAIRDMINAVKINDSIFVVGKGAPDFVAHLNDIERRLIDLDRSPRHYP